MWNPRDDPLDLFSAQPSEATPIAWGGENRIGREDFERAKDIKSWMLDHPKQRDILAFLLDDES